MANLNIFKEKLLLGGVGAILLLWLVSFTIWFFRREVLTESLFLPRGFFLERVGERADAFFLVILGAVLNLMNLVLAERVFLRQRFGSYLLIGGTVFLNVLLLIALAALAAYN